MQRGELRCAEFLRVRHVYPAQSEETPSSSTTALVGESAQAAGFIEENVKLLQSAAVAERGKIQEEIRQAVIAHEVAQKWLQGEEPSNMIVVKGRIINVVI